MSDNQKFWLVFTPTLFICLWITMGILSSVLNPQPQRPDSREVFQQECIKQGKVPDTNINAEVWRCM